MTTTARNTPTQLDVYQLTSKTQEEMSCHCSICNQQSLKTCHSSSLCPLLSFSLTSSAMKNMTTFSCTDMKNRHQTRILYSRHALCMSNQTDGHHLYGLTMALYSQTKLYIPALPLSLIRIQCQGWPPEITAIIAECLCHL